MLSQEEKSVINALVKAFTGNDVRGSTFSGTVHANIQKRIRDVHASGLKAYLFKMAQDPDEIDHFISAATIHTTFWFREISHFEFLEANIKEQGIRKPKIWSVACSTGPEPFSMALVLQSMLESGEIDDYEILATDVDRISIQKGKSAKYSLDQLDQVPKKYHRHLVFTETHFSPVPQIVSRVYFYFHDIFNGHSGAMGLKKMDYIFCRNVLIYFGQDSIKKITDGLKDYLASDGSLVLGHCESLNTANPESYVLRNRSIYHHRALTFQKKAQKNVLVVEDQETIQKFLKKILQNDYKLFFAKTTSEADNILGSEIIDLVSLDLNLGQDSGEDWLREKRKAGFAQPVIIVSEFDHMSKDRVVRSLFKDASDFVTKSDLFQRPEAILETVQLILGREVSVGPKLAGSSYKGRPDALLIGGSTGAIQVINKILEEVYAPFPPIVIVQHMNFDFTKVFANLIRQNFGFDVEEVFEPTPLERSKIYIAGRDSHLVLVEEKGELLAKLRDEAPIHGHRPSVDHLFFSASYLKKNFLTLLLSGMGRDGAQGLLSLFGQNQNFNVIQDEQSSVVFGMPGEALKLGAANAKLNVDEIRDLIRSTLSHGVKVSA